MIKRICVCCKERKLGLCTSLFTETKVCKFCMANVFGFGESELVVDKNGHIGDCIIDSESFNVMGFVTKTIPPRYWWFGYTLTIGLLIDTKEGAVCKEFKDIDQVNMYLNEENYELKVTR